MFDLFDSISKIIYVLKDAIVLAKGRTPTQRDRVAENVFDWYIGEELDKDRTTTSLPIEKIRTIAKLSYVLADAFLEGKEQYEKDRKNKA